MSVLPDWLRDLDTILGVGTGLAAVFSFILGKLISAALPPRQRAAQPERLPKRRRSAPSAGFLGTFLTHLILRPDVPLGQDTSRVATGYLILAMMLGCLFILPDTSQAAYDLPQRLAAITRPLAIFGVLAGGAFMALLTIRLSWKMDYLNRVEHDDEE